MSENPSTSSLAETFYSAARAEAVERLALRDQTFLAWIAAATGLFGVAIYVWNASAPERAAGMLEVIVFMSVPFSLAVYRHQLIIGYISKYIHDELGDFLLQGDQLAPRHWNGSKAIGDKLRRFISLETAIHSFFLTIVPIFCAWYLHRNKAAKTPLWLQGIGLSIGFLPWLWEWATVLSGMHPLPYDMTHPPTQTQPKKVSADAPKAPAANPNKNNP